MMHITTSEFIALLRAAFYSVEALSEEEQKEVERLFRLYPEHLKEKSK